MMLCHPGGCRIAAILRPVALALIGCCIGLTASGCCLVDAFFPPNPFEKDLALLSPQTVSLHTQIPYLGPTGPDACGLSCLDMIFAYHHITLPAADIAVLREKAAQENGLTVNDIVALLQKAGFKTLRRQGRLDWPPADRAVRASSAESGVATAPPPPWYKNINNPLSQIHFRRPVILRLVLPPDSGHFVLLVGYDTTNRSYILLNPGSGPMVVPAEKLEPLWRAGERVFIAYKPPDAPPPK